MWIKRLLFFITSVVYASTAFSQISITGSIKDNQQNLPLVTVLLLNLDSTMVKGAVTDQTGNFTIENVMPGFYLISASMVGYSSFISQQIHVASANIDLNETILDESATQLGELTVNA